MQASEDAAEVEEATAVHTRAGKPKAAKPKETGAGTAARSAKASRSANEDEDIIDVDALDRFRVFREEKFIYAEDLVEAFSTPRQPYSIKRARRLIVKSRGFQECDRGRWMCLRIHFAEANPELYVALVEHEVDQL